MKNQIILSICPYWQNSMNADDLAVDLDFPWLPKFEKYKDGNPEGIVSNLNLLSGGNTKSDVSLSIRGIH